MVPFVSVFLSTVRRKMIIVAAKGVFLGKSLCKRDNTNKDPLSGSHLALSSATGNDVQGGYWRFGYLSCNVLGSLFFFP